MSEDLAALLERLKVMVRDAKSVPMSSSVMINRGEAAALIDDVIARADEEFAEARRVIAARDAERRRGQEEGDQIRVEAEEWAEQMAASSEVANRAREKAEQILSDAHGEAEALRQETDMYVETRMAEFEASLAKVTQQVRQVRERIGSRTHIGHADDTTPLPKI